MKITIISGSTPPDLCGVGDYSFKLYEALKKEENISVSLIKMNDFSFKNILNNFRTINNLKNEKIILQYPTRGYKRSFQPFFLSLFFYKNIFLNIHEFSNSKIKGKLATWLFFITGSKYIFTTEYEKNCAIKFAPWIKKKCFVVNIGSNIPFKIDACKEYDLIYFGIIEKNKGIENFFDFAKSVRKKYSDHKISIIGRASEDENFLNFCKDNSLKLDISLFLDKDFNEVATLLSKSKIAFLPFPDGATFRRGSLLACLGNNVEIITTKNNAEKNDFLDKIVFFNNSQNNIELYDEIISGNKKNINLLHQEFINKFSWENIGKNFINILKNF